MAVRDEKVIQALLTHPTKRKAAEACGISEAALYARMKKTAFKEKYDRARLDELKENSNRLQQHISGAIETMGFLATHAKNEQTRLNAAESIIRTALKLTEQLDIIERLEQLEELQKRQ